LCLIPQPSAIPNVSDRRQQQSQRPRPETIPERPNKMLLQRHNILPSISFGSSDNRKYCGIPTQELNVGVPTGRPKILCFHPYELNIKANNAENITKPIKLYFVGLMDKPITLSSTKNINVIGIDFTVTRQSDFKCPAQATNVSIFTRRIY
jgi:hypothetical protein